MKVIALRGDVSTGKSHVINIVYQFLLQDGWVQVPTHFRILGNPAYEDIIDILQKGAQTIGVIGAGDYQIGAIALSKLLKELELKGCDIAVCACRTNPKIEAAVNNYANHFWHDKTTSTGRENDRIVNGIDATALFNLV